MVNNVLHGAQLHCVGVGAGVCRVTGPGVGTVQYNMKHDDMLGTQYEL